MILRRSFDFNAQYYCAAPMTMALVLALAAEICWLDEI